VALLPAILPPDYPDTDFYGDPIHGGGAAGAIQPSTAYGGAHYYLELSVNGPLKGSVTVSPSPDADGFYPVSSTITITASPTGGYSLGYWLVNGVKTDTAPVNLSAHTWVQAVFGRAVTDFTDGEGSASTPGTLRHALTNAVNGDIITFIGATAGTTTITLESPLPEITKSLTIEGNGVTLTRAASWTAISDTSRLLGINGATAEVVVRRVHFKDSLALRSGGAIYSNANLTLESCIFSGNRVTASDAYGGALYSSYTLTLRGCTIYGNTSNYRGGAVYFSSSGTLILTGNLFYGNTAASGYPAVYSSGTVTASYNVVDVAFGTADTQAGWDAGTGDTAISAALPVSGTSFRLLYESEAGDKLPGTLPADYPDTDFYGNPIHGDGAAGAVQAGTEQGAGYYYLETSVNSSLRGNVTVNSPPDADGCYPAGSSITANSNSKYSFGYWLVNGVKTTTATLSLSAHSWIQAVFINPLVTDFTDGPGSASTPGTLRHALTNAQDGDIITFIGVTAGTTTIALESPLPEITTGLTIEGNGVTLTRAASWTAADSQLLVTYSPAEVLIRRVHFKDGLATRDGGAIYNNGGTLTLESCIFSGNRVMTLSTSYYGNGGGAICSNNTLTIRGCTFYGNTSNYRGGAVYFSSSGTLTLTGNLFYGNTAASSYPVVYNYNYSGTINASYNAVDVALGTANTQAGWTIGTGDTTISAALPVSPKSFRLLYGSEAGGKLPGTLPVDYPDTDFYGSPIHGGGTAGAVQAGTEQGAGYYYLEASVNNSLWGSVTVSPPPDADGLCPAGSTIITPSPAGGFSLSYWLVNEVTAGTAPFSLSAHSRVQAVFNRQVTVNILTDGTEPGTLRYALANAQDGDRINMSGVTAGTTTITLGSALPEITKSLIIEGNGVTLTRAASWTAASTSQLLRIRNSFTEVLIRRVHFKDSRTTGSGGAIYTDGILTLESCIFSGNQVTSGNGGAITSGNNTLTIRGCTFYGNTASSSVGAVYFISMVTKTLTLTGNLFYGNTAPSKPVVSISSYDPLPPFKVISYNVVDRSFGTGDTQAGWDAGTGDTTFTALGISGTPVNTTSFVPVTELSGVLPSAPAGFPATDFYGATRTFPGAPGAVKAP
jgi:predicted outer membrane repeat protein